MAFSFSKVGKLKQPKRKRKTRKPAPQTPVHNFMDVAEAVTEIARIIDPEAFIDLTDRDLQIANRRAIATQKARDAVRTYDKLLGTQRHIRIMIKEHGRIRYKTITKGNKPQR